MARWAPLALPSPSNTPMVVMPGTSVCWLLPSWVLLCALCKRRSKHSLLVITAAPSPCFPSPHQLSTRQTTPGHQNNCQHVCIFLRASMHRSKIWQQRCLAISRYPWLPGDFIGWHSKTLYFLSSNFVTHNIASCPNILAVQDDPKVSLLGGHMTKAKAVLLAVWHHVTQHLD